MRRVKAIPLKDWARNQGIPYSTALLMVREGKLQAQRLGRYWYVVNEVEAGSTRGVTFTLFTHAGGAGKTSLARDLGYEMASRGRRVLVVDMDPQANLTTWLGVEGVEPGDTVLALLEDLGDPEPRQVLPGLDLIPANVELARAELLLQQKPFHVMALRNFLGELRQEYDLILVDSPPSLGVLAVSAALSGDGLLVPVEAGPKGIEALPTVLKVAREYGRSLERAKMWTGESFVRAFIPTKVDATRASREALDALEALGGVAPLAPGLAYRPGVYKQASLQRLPVQVVGGEEVVQELRALGNFLEERLLPVAGQEVKA